MMFPRGLIALLALPALYLGLLLVVVDVGVVSALLAPSDAAGVVKLLAATSLVVLRIVCVFLVPPALVMWIFWVIPPRRRERMGALPR